jgi:hypothetical protein
MSAVRFLLDENVAPLYRRELLRRDPALIVWKVGDVSAPPGGMLDPDLLAWCEENAFILVTNNRKSMPAHLRDHLAEGRHIPGILVLNEKMSVSETVEDLWLIWATSDQEEYLDTMIYLPVR